MKWRIHAIMSPCTPTWELLSNFSTYIPTMSGCRTLTTIYDIPATSLRVIGLTTLAVDAYRGAGRPEANYLMERLMDHIASITARAGSRSEDKYDQRQKFPMRCRLVVLLTRRYGLLVGCVERPMSLDLLDENRKLRQTDGFEPSATLCIFNNAEVAHTPAWRLNFSTMGGLICMRRNNAMVRDIAQL